jgi:hypothetical protein
MVAFNIDKHKNPIGVVSGGVLNHSVFILPSLLNPIDKGNP